MRRLESLRASELSKKGVWFYLLVFTANGYDMRSTLLNK